MNSNESSPASSPPLSSPEPSPPLSASSNTLRSSRTLTTTSKTLNRKSKILSYFKGSASCAEIPAYEPPTPPPQPVKPLMPRGPSIILPSHILITVVFPTEGWLLDLKIAKVATADHIWGLISLHRKIEDQESYGLFTEKGTMMVDNIPAVNFKIKNRDMLTIKPRLKKDVKQQVKIVLNTFLKRRPSVIEISGGGADPSKKLPINSSLFHQCTEYLISIEGHKHEGIFRLSPSAVELQVFFESVVKAAPDFSLVTSPHTVAAAIKQYIRSLPNTLIFHPTSSIMAGKLRDCVNTKDVLIREFSVALAKLPSENLDMLAILFGFLLLVVSNTEYSKMTSRNLSIVFGPNLVSFDNNVDVLAQAQVGTEIVDAIISNWENIYGLLSACKR